MHTPMAQAVHRPHAHCALAVRTTSCRGAQGAVSWLVERRIMAPGLHVAGRLLPYCRPPVAIQNCIVTSRPMPNALRTVSRAHNAVSQRTLCCVPCCIATQKVAPSHDTKFVSLLIPSCQAPRALSQVAPRVHLLLTPCAGRSCRKSCHERGWSYRSPAVLPSTHPLGRIVAWCPYCVMKQYVVS